MNSLMTVVGSKAASFPYLQNPRAKEILPKSIPAKIPDTYHNIWMACAVGNTEELSSLLKKTGEDVGSITELFFVKSLLHNFDALLRFSEDARMDFVSFAVTCAYRWNSVETLVFLCAKWAMHCDMHATNNRAMRLIVSIAVSNESEVDDLLRRHCDPSAMNGLPVILAIRFGLVDIVKRLFAHKRVRVGANRSAFLVYAASQPSRELFDLVISHPDTSVSKAGHAAAMAALSEDLPEYLCVLLQHPDWPRQHSEVVVDAVVELSCHNVAYLPVLQIARDLIEQDTGNRRSTEMTIKRVQARLREMISSHSGVDEKELAEVTEQLREVEKALGL